METNFKKNLGASYLIIDNLSEFEPEENLVSAEDTYTFRMLENNKADILLPLSTETLNGKERFLYDISSRQPLGDIYEHEKLTASVLSGFIRSLYALSDILTDYLLDADCVLFEPDYIFTNSERSRFYYCALPGFKTGFRDSLRELFNRVLSVIDYDDQKTVTLAFSLNRAVQNDNFVIKDLLSLCNAPFEEAMAEQNGGHDNSLNYGYNYGSDYASENKDKRSSNAGFAGSSDFSDFTDASKSPAKPDARGTALKSSAPEEDGPSLQNLKECRPSFTEKAFSKLKEGLKAKGIRFPLAGSLFCEKPAPTAHECGLYGLGLHKNDTVNIDHFPFTIGRRGDMTDASLAHPSISRLHARIYENCGGAGKKHISYMIEDLNSTNGTFLNGKRIPSNTKVAVALGDVVQLADVKFCFR